MFAREKKPADPVTIYLDGKAIEAERGEPLAQSLLAVSALRIARSPKLHRPRGPSCLRGDCDGCLARVNDVPNVMLCMRRAEGGERIVTQNVLGSRETDLLRITDWFFPKGIDHHHLMAGIPGVTDVMQTFARKLAGIGRLPITPVAPREAKRFACDVLVVGAGLAGTVAFSELARAGLDVHLVDDGFDVGGVANAAGHTATKILEKHTVDQAKLHLEATVFGIFGGEAVIAGANGAEVTKSRAIVLATGAHDGVIAVPNNDLPGVMSARALVKMGASGVLPSAPVALVGDGFWADRCREVFGSRIAIEVSINDLLEIEGSSRVKGVRTKGARKAGGARDDEGSTKTPVRLVAVAAPGAPSFELAEMAGASVEHSNAGYRVACGPHGRATPSVWAVGECTGAPFDPAALSRAAKDCAKDVAAQVADSKEGLSPR